MLTDMGLSSDVVKNFKKEKVSHFYSVLMIALEYEYE